MSKIKTKKAASKRFARLASGRIKRYRSHRSHILDKKKTNRKRHLRDPAQISASEVRSVRRMMPYA